MLIHDMNTGDRFEGYYILQNIAQRTTAAGKPFLTLNLVDRSGSVTAQVWDYTGPISQSDVGKVAWIAGLASEYRGAPQVTVHRIRLAEENDDYRVSDLVATAPIQMDETWEWLKETVNSMEDEDYRALCQEDCLCTRPTWSGPPAFTPSFIRHWIAVCCFRALCSTTCVSARSLSPRLWAWWRSIR